MDDELKSFLSQVIVKALLFSVPIFIAAFFLFKIPGLLAAITGTVVSGGGFALSTHILSVTLKDGRGVFLPSAVSLLKTAVTASAAAFFFIRYGLGPGLLFMASFIMIFPSFYLFGRYNEVMNPPDVSKYNKLQEMDDKKEKSKP